jgi:hypothetical protein
MTDFDKLIKEKAEQAEYPYKAGAWRQFRRNTGFGTGGHLTHWLVGASSLLVVGGATVVLLNRHPQQAPLNEPQVQAVVQDTLNVLPGEAADTVAEAFGNVGQSPVKVTDRPHTASASTSTRQEEASSEETTVRNKKSETYKEKPRYGRPLVIDVDTIKENVPSDEELKNGHSRLY